MRFEVGGRNKKVEAEVEVGEHTPPSRGTMVKLEVTLPVDIRRRYPEKFKQGHGVGENPS